MPGTISPRRSLKPTPSRPLARIAPPSSAPSSPNAGAYGEAEPCGSTQRSQPRAEERAEREPAERQHADDEALPEAEDREHRRKRDY